MVIIVVSGSSGSGGEILNFKCEQWSAGMAYFI